MTRIFYIGILCLLMLGCKDRSASTTPAAAVSITQDSVDFFPVTSFIKGQILDIRQRYKSPLKKITIGSRMDSSWTKMDSLEIEFAPFLQPEIDSANMKKLFTQTSFMDQTLDAVTFTYDPSDALPDSFPLRHWDVYIDPQTGNVRRIYMLKKIGETTQQLTWQAGQWCKIVTIKANKEGSTQLEQEQMFTWNY